MRTESFPKVAVLLAAYNGMQWIGEQVQSILSQKGVAVTLFVSVDLSSDGTEKWVRELSDKYSNVVMLPYGERFGGAGANFFRLIRDVSFSGFDTVAFSDQDDIWFERKLQRACSLIESGSFDVYSSNVTAFWPDGRQALVEKSQPQKRFDHFFEPAGPGCTYVFNVSAAFSFKNFVQGLGVRINQVEFHDWLAYAFCRERGFLWFIDKEPSMFYRQHAGNQVGANEGIHDYLKRLNLVKNKWYRKQVNLIINVVAPGCVTKMNSRFFLFSNCFDLRRRGRDCFALLLFLITGLY